MSDQDDLDHRTLHVVVVDDQELLRRGLRMLLESTGTAAVVAEARNGRHALTLLDAPGCDGIDAIVTDAVMPEMGGADLIRALAERHPALPVVVVTTFDTEHIIADLADAGAAAILLKDTSPEAIVAAVRAALRGEMTLDPRIARKALATAPAEPDPGAALTPTERDVANGVADGLTNAEIADQLHLAPGTVKNYVSTIMGKLQTPDRTKLALLIDRARREN